MVDLSDFGAVKRLLSRAFVLLLVVAPERLVVTRCLDNLINLYLLAIYESLKTVLLSLDLSYTVVKLALVLTKLVLCTTFKVLNACVLFLIF